MEAVKRSINELMTVATQRNFNRLGKKGKHCFDSIEDLLLKPTIVSIVPSATHKDIEKCIAIHRLGGRKKRDATSNAVPTSNLHSNDSCVGNTWKQVLSQSYDSSDGNSD